MVDMIPKNELKVGHFYQIKSRYGLEKHGKERIIAKYLGGIVGDEWEVVGLKMWGHTCDGHGREGYCMYERINEIYCEIPEKDIWLWQI